MVLFLNFQHCGEEHDNHSNYFILIPSVNCNTLITNYC